MNPVHVVNLNAVIKFMLLMDSLFFTDLTVLIETNGIVNWIDCKPTNLTV